MNEESTSINEVYSYKTTIRNILRSYKLIFYKQPFLLILKILSVGISPILSYLILLLSRNVVNQIEHSGSSFVNIALCILITFALEVISRIYDKVLFFFSDLTSTAFTESLKSLLFKKIVEDVPISDLEEPGFYDDVQAISSTGVNCVIGSLSTPITMMTSIVSLLIAVYTSFQYEFYLYYLYIAILPLVFILETIARRRSIFAFEKKGVLQRKASILDALLRKKSTIFDIKAFEGSEWLINETKERKNASFFFSERESLIYSLLLQLRDILNSAFKYAVLIYLMVSIYYGRITFGDYTLLFGLATNFMICTRNAATEFGWLRESFFFMNRFYAFMDQRKSKTEGSLKNNDSALIQIKNVSFSYPGTNANQLADVNMSIRKGEKIAILGYNGSGKTTLIKVLLGLYTPQCGTLFYDGVRYQDIDPEKLYAHFTIAFQNHIKYPLSLINNITFGLQKSNKYSEAISNSNLTDVIDKLPKGENTYLNKEFYADGIDLSGGEWNKLILARSLYYDRDVLIFDEPLAAVDVKTEASFIQTLIDKYKQKTVIIVSHRLSCIKMVDRIIVMQDGRIVEDGSHDELMRLKNHYFRFYNAQIEGFTI